MNNTVINFFLESKHLFNKDVEPRLELLEGWSKTTLVKFLARINYLVHDNAKITHSIKNSIDIWLKTTYSDEGRATEIIFRSLEKYTIQKANYTQKAIIFNRLTNLYILKKILVQDLYGSTEYEDNIEENQLINFLKFYTGCTKEVLAHERNNVPDEFSDAEKLAFKNLPIYAHNNSSPVRLSYFDLIYAHYIATIDSPDLGAGFKEFINGLGITSNMYLNHYIGGIFHSFRNTARPESVEIEGQDDYSIKSKEVFNVLSSWNEKIDNSFFDFTSIKKYPFYKISEQEYIKLDHSYAISKFHTTIYDDCFFDFYKPKGIEIKWYNGVRGIINEQIITNSLNVISSRLRYTNLIFGNKLKTDSEGNQLDYEIADYYVRRARKIFIAEIKSSSLSVAQLTGKIEDILSKQGNDLKDFLSKFGIQQLVQHVKRVIYTPKLFEKRMPDDLKIYPCLIVSEEALNSPLIIKLLRDSFNTLLEKEIPSHEHTIKPLCLIRDIDVFRMEASGIGRFIWYILDKHGRDESNGILGGSIDMRLNRLNIQEPRRKFKLAQLAGFK